MNAYSRLKQVDMVCKNTLTHKKEYNIEQETSKLFQKIDGSLQRKCSTVTRTKQLQIYSSYLNDAAPEDEFRTLYNVKCIIVMKFED